MKVLTAAIMTRKHCSQSVYFMLRLVTKVGMVFASRYVIVSGHVNMSQTKHLVTSDTIQYPSVEWTLSRGFCWRFLVLK